MAEITDAELTTVENALVTVREGLQNDGSPQTQKVMQMIVEAEQIISAKLDQGGDTAGAPTGTGNDMMSPPVAQ